MSTNLQKIIYLSQSQYNTLAGDGTITNSNEESLTGLNDDYIYITSDPLTFADIEGILPVNKGGTNKNQWTINSIPYASGTGTISEIAPNNTTTKMFLTMANNAPSWNIIEQGDLPVMTGATSLADGAKGAVPKPTTENLTSFLQGDATWYKLNVRNGAGDNSVVINDLTNNIASGDYSYAEGYYAKATGNYSHAEGYFYTTSNSIYGSHGYATHAEGYQTYAVGTQGAHAEGIWTRALGPYGSHAEGEGSAASGYDGAHAEGYYTTASGSHSHAEGRYTVSNHKSQHVFGEYNIQDPSSAVATERGNYVEIVGNGIDISNPSNARTLDWSGNEWIANNLTVAGTLYASPPTLTLTLPSTGWSSNAQTITAAGVGVNSLVVVGPAPASMAVYSAAGIRCTAQGANSLTFTTDVTPTADMTIYVVIYDQNSSIAVTQQSNGVLNIT